MAQKNNRKTYSSSLRAKIAENCGDWIHDIAKANEEEDGWRSVEFTSPYSINLLIESEEDVIYEEDYNDVRLVAQCPSKLVAHCQIQL